MWYSVLALLYSCLGDAVRWYVMRTWFKKFSEHNPRLFHLWVFEPLHHKVHFNVYNMLVMLERCVHCTQPSLLLEKIYKKNRFPTTNNLKAVHCILEHFIMWWKIIITREWLLRKLKWILSGIKYNQNSRCVVHVESPRAGVGRGLFEPQHLQLRATCVSRLLISSCRCRWTEVNSVMI